MLGHFPLTLPDLQRKAVNKATRQIPGRRWDPLKGVWWIPNEHIFVVANLIKGIVPNYTQRLLKSDRFEEARAAASVGQVVVDMSKAIDADINIPCPDGCTPLPFQRGGVAYACQEGRDAVLLADEMGLGKTIQSILIANFKGFAKILIICPASLKINWYRETMKWLLPTKRILVVDSQTPKRAVSMNDVLIINYDILGKWLPELQKRHWQYVIADEAHYIKNESAQRSRNTALLTADADYRALLTGTPIVNKPHELWYLLFVLDPETWEDLNWYQRRYCDGRRDSSGKWVYDGASNLSELQLLLRKTIMVRRLKCDVLKELPPKFRQLVEISAKGIKYQKVLETEKRYAAEMENALKAVEGAALDVAKAEIDAAIKRADETKETLSEEVENKFRDAVKHLHQQKFGNFGHIARVRHDTAMAKVDDVIGFAKATLENVEKIVIFAHHHDVMDALMAAFDKTAVCVRGGVSQKDRQLAVDRFQNDPTIRVFVGGMYAAGIGLTLTASHTVIFAEIDWVPGIIIQSEDRCHRIGQLDNVTVYYIVLENSLDYRLAQTIINKLEIIEQALDKMETSHDISAAVHDIAACASA
jgi:SWI/SNF-related matrix-associated actin-dependent regulator of chromatin subfamily A-like protein 1